MRILFLGDVVGPSGCEEIKKNLKAQIKLKISKLLNLGWGILKK